MRRWFIVFFSFILIIYMNLTSAFTGWGSKLYYPPSPLIKYASFGHKDTIADIFWIRLLQDFGVCEQNRSTDNSDSTGRHMGLQRTPKCQLGWMYHMLDLIMELAPKFHIVARTGPIGLSVIADDIDGATLLFDKAMHNFPDDWVIKFRAAYHYLLELEDKRRASQLFLDAYKNGGPEWAPLLAAKLSEKSGDTLVAKFILEEFLKGDLKELKNRKAAEDKLEQIKKGGDVTSPPSEL